MEFSYLISALGALTYTLGALLYGLPIPFRKLKEWAPKLVGDGIYITFWSASYNNVVFLANAVESFFYVSWTQYLGFVQGVQQYFITALIPLQALQSITPISFAPTTTISLLFIITATLFTAIVVISNIVYQYWSLLSALGILLMAVPFRISRSAGATLLSFSLTFYFGLPPMLDFMKLLGAGSVHLGFGQFLSNPWACLVQTAPADLIEYFILVPITYLTLLAAITADLADTIGGYSGKVPFDINKII